MREKYRHECKYPLSYSDILILRRRLQAVMQPDPHAINGRYLIRSLYFDTPTDKALREKLNGVSHREKFRIRCYNGNYDMIRLEKKSKFANLCSKQSAFLSREEVERMINGDIGFMTASERPLVRELYTKMKQERFLPKTLVDYTREPFVFPAGNVRVTLDYNIRTGLNSTDFLNPDCVTVPTPDNMILLEVKWDEFLPDIIRSAVQLTARRGTAFSKYVQCRTYDF